MNAASGAQVDRPRDRFAQALKAGTKPKIEDYLPAVGSAPDGDPEERLTVLRELVQLEIEERRLRGETPRSGEYLTRFRELDPVWLAGILAANTQRKPPVSAERPAMVRAPSYLNIEQFRNTVIKLGVLSESEFSRLLADLPESKRPANAESLAKFLVDADKLTKYQAKCIYQGKGDSLSLGEYLLVDKIGEGGMGVVMRARHRRMDRIVALKVLSAAATKQDHAIERFQREVKAAAKLVHPNIVNAYDASEYSGIHYLVMEFVEGKDLSAYVRKLGPLSIPNAIEYVVQTARGLQYAHDMGVVHRDIKPHNLLLTFPTVGVHKGQGVVKILDMGLARIESQIEPAADLALTKSGMIMGTASFMAPEQARDTRRVDGRADIYSLGCTLHYLLTGAVAYERDGLLETILAHQEQPIVSLRDLRPEVPDSLDRVFQKMIAKRPEDRQASMSEVVAELSAVQSQLSLDAVAEPSIAVHFSDEKESPGWLREISLGPTVAYRRAPDSTKQESTRSVTSPTLKVRPVPLPDDEEPAWKTFVRTHWKTLVVAFAIALPLVVGLYVRRHSVQRERLRAARELAEAEAEFAANSATIAGKFKETKPSRDPFAGTPVLAVVPFSEDDAKRHQREWAQAKKADVEFVDSAGIRLVLIPAGEFRMGSSETEVESLLSGVSDRGWRDRFRSEAPSHVVRITEPFYIAATETTLAQFRRFMTEEPGYRTDSIRNQQGWGVVNEQWTLAPGFDWQHLGEQTMTDQHPAGNISWNDSQAFCAWLSKKEKAVYRLPTEAQWEFACRAGTNTWWNCGDDANRLEDCGWFNANSGGRIHAVAQKQPNAFGLFDMHGNEWERCADRYGPDYFAQSPSQNPTGPTRGNLRILKGGGFGNSPAESRSAARFWNEESTPAHGSFRVIRLL